LEHERAAGRDDLILPIYFVEAAVLENPELTAADNLAAKIVQRQRWDWRPVALESFADPVVRKEVRRLVLAIKERLDVEATETQRTAALGLARSTIPVAPFEGGTKAAHTAPSAPPSVVDRSFDVPDAAARGEVKADHASNAIDRRPPSRALDPEQRSGPTPKSEAPPPRAGSAGITPSKPPTRGVGQLLMTAAGVLAVGGLALGLYIYGSPELEQPTVTTATPAPGQTFTDTLADGSLCPFCPEMVMIPAGSFTMGSSATERKWSVEEGGTEDEVKDEQPAHTVRLAAGFALGRTEITRRQFARFVAATGRDMSGGCYSWTGSEWKLDAAKNWRSPGFDQDDTHPAVCVSWDDAVAYAAWLAEQTGEAYRLPSEAEWEYAAHAGSTTMRFWGDDLNNRDVCTYANAADLTAKDEFPGWRMLDCRDGSIYTSSVGKYRKNDFELVDTMGNVWEWNQDCYHDSYNGAPSDGSSWTSDDCSSRVLRGGSWVSVPRLLRSADRNWVAPDYRGDVVGFRVARALTP
jgi:formylglycine-generating enzyme required for sulfatase activity